MNSRTFRILHKRNSNHWKMSEIKAKAQGLDANIHARNMEKMVHLTHNIYESLVIIGKRANQISVGLKQELTTKLEDFATQTETIEEVQENKEQIEISKYYERLPNPAIIATNEYLHGDLHFHYKQIEEDED